MHVYKHYIQKYMLYISIDYVQDYINKNETKMFLADKEKDKYIEALIFLQKVMLDY